MFQKQGPFDADQGGIVWVGHDREETEVSISHSARAIRMLKKEGMLLVYQHIYFTISDKMCGGGGGEKLLLTRSEAKY